MARAAAIHVVADGHDIAIHPLQVAGNRDFLDRIGYLSALDPIAGCTARVVATDRIHALTHELGHEHAPAHSAEQRRQIIVAMAHDEIVVASGITGGSEAELAGRIAAQEIALHGAVPNHVARTGGYALVIERHRRASFIVTSNRDVGEWVGLFADPILANSALVTTDIGVSLFFLLGVYAFYRYIKNPTLLRLLLAGIAAGLLLATKHSGILLAPMLLLLIGSEILCAPKGTRGKLALRLTGAFATMPAASAHASVCRIPNRARNFAERL